MRAVPIPGEILRTDVFLGLTFNELITLSSAPIVLVFPSLFIQQIPLVVSLGLAALFAVGVVGVVLQTPEGQTPLEWAPAAAKRRLSPDTYYLKPRHRERDELRYLDVVRTAESIHARSVAEQEPPASATADTHADGDRSEDARESAPDIGQSVTADTLGPASETEASSDGEHEERSDAVPATE